MVTIIVEVVVVVVIIELEVTFKFITEVILVYFEHLYTDLQID